MFVFTFPGLIIRRIQPVQQRILSFRVVFYPTIRSFLMPSAPLLLSVLFHTVLHCSIGGVGYCLGILVIQRLLRDVFGFCAPLDRFFDPFAFARYGCGLYACISVMKKVSSNPEIYANPGAIIFDLVFHFIVGDLLIIMLSNIIWCLRFNYATSLRINPVVVTARPAQ